MITKSVLFYYIMISGTKYTDFFITENDIKFINHYLCPFSIKKSYSMSTDTSMKELKIIEQE